MLYKVKGLRTDDGRSGFATHDGVVVEARPALTWALGKDVKLVMAWCFCNGLTVKVRQSERTEWRIIQWET